MMEEGLMEIIDILLAEDREDLVEVLKKMTELIDADFEEDNAADTDDTDDDTVNEELELKIDMDGFHSLA